MNVSKKEKQEWILANCVDEDGDISLNDLEFPSHDVYFSRVNARTINNNSQKSDYIYNHDQEATGIYNYTQKAKEIYNLRQQAAYKIDNSHQKSERIHNNRQKAEGITNNFQEADKIFNHRQKAKEIDNDYQVLIESKELTMEELLEIAQEKLGVEVKLKQ